jgi:hypothetical protein
MGMGSQILLALFRGVVDYDSTMPMLAMAILVHFWMQYWMIGPSTITLL